MALLPAACRVGGGIMTARDESVRDEAAAVRSAMHAELTPLLVRRMRAGIWLLVAALLLFGLEIPWVYPEHRAALIEVKIVQLITLVWAYWMLWQRAEWQRSIVVGLIVIAEVCVTTVISSIITDDPVSAMLLFIVLCMGTAMLLPWGVWPQFLTASVAATMIGVNLAEVKLPPGGIESSAVASLLAFLTSIYASYSLDRSRFARALAEARERTSTAWRGAVIEAALDCIITIDHEGKILEFNPAAERVFGYGRAEVLGTALADAIIPPALREYHRQGLARFAATGEATRLGRRIETTAMRSDGSEFPVELAITRIPQPGPPIFVGYVRDVTALAQEARTASALARVGNEIMPLLDTRLILDRMCSLTVEVLGCDCSDSWLWREQDDAYVRCAGQARAPESASSRAGGWVARAALAPLFAWLQRDEPLPVTRDGPRGAGPSEPLLHQGVTTALHMALYQGDEVIGVHTAGYHGRSAPFTPQELRIARGIAQAASLALSNARLIEQVEQAHHAKSEFLSTMSHELRTPLTALLGYAEILEEGEVDAAERAHCVHRIRSTGTELLELIESTLEIGRLDAGRDEVRMEAISFRGFWQTLAERCAQMPRQAEVSFDWNADVPDVAVVTDPRKLAVVLRNLISNALKYTERGTVDLDARLSGESMIFRVSDTGLGIAADEQSKIFEMFRQGNDPDARRHGGTGLGLFIVQRFVEQLGGNVTVESAPGHGATFTVTLPRHNIPTEPVSPDRLDIGARNA
jgi:PAS domain S-box-containing protein